MRRLLLSALLCALCAATLPHEASAQAKRPSKALYIYPRVGMSWYTGDFDATPLIHFWDEGGQLPWIGGLELGYDVNPHVGFGVGYDLGNFPTIQGVKPVGTNYRKRHIVTALVRWTPGGINAKHSPYFEIGAMVNNGQERNRTPPIYNPGDIRPAYGPLLGVGFDIAVSGRASLMLGGHLGAQFSDSRTDQSDEFFNGVRTSAPKAAGPFDLLGGFGLGLKYHFKDAFSPVDVMAVDGPSSLECGQTGTFTATVADGATMPVEYRWDFGDGGTGEGLVATHSFTRPGTYTVTFSGSNSGSMDSASTTVTCTPPPVPASRDGGQRHAEPGHGGPAGDVHLLRPWRRPGELQLELRRRLDGHRRQPDPRLRTSGHLYGHVYREQCARQRHAHGARHGTGCHTSAGDVLGERAQLGLLRRQLLDAHRDRTPGAARKHRRTP